MTRTSIAAIILFGAFFASACDKNELTSQPAPTPAPELGSIAGRVCAPNGSSWLSGADVWVVRPNGTQDSTTTNSTGNFLLGGVTAGSQTLNIQEGSFSSQQQVTVLAGQTVTLPAPACVQQTPVAVILGNDKIESILSGAGITQVTLYGTGTGAVGTADALLGNPTLMATYKIIFINCLSYDSTTLSAANIANLQAYVNNGGSLYASDWAYDWIAQAFPTEIQFYGGNSTPKTARVGNSGTITGTVSDPGLATAMGHPTVNINFSLGEWAMAQTVPASGKTLITGTVTYKDSSGNTQTATNAPLVVQFPVGSNHGSVIFTSFHNETQITADMTAALNYMVFQL